MKRTLTAAVVLVVPTLIAPPAAAQDVAERFQLALGTPLVAYTKSSYEFDVDVLGDVDVDLSSTRWGVADNPVMLELGYGLDELIVLGGFVQLGGASASTEIDDLGYDNDESRFQVAVGPKLDLMFVEGGAARPFVTVQMGIVHVSTEVETQDTRYTGFRLGAGGGVRLFPTSGVSIDPALALGWATLKGDVEDSTLGDVDVKGSELGVTVSLGVSAWIP